MTASTTNLEEAIRDAGEDWLLRWFEPPEQAMPRIRQTLHEVNLLARQRFGQAAPELSESALVESYNRYPLKVKGFFQVLGGTRTPDMLLMAWRIIQGMEIKDVSISYRRKKQFAVRIALESPDGGGNEVYESSQIQDFALFRHIGIMEVSGQPVFDGFYALQVK